MPILFFFAYFVVETLAFWAVAKAIGLGWALVALFVTMLFGMSIAMWEVRRLISARIHPISDGRIAVETSQAGKLAGNVGLTLAGGLLLSAPGFVSTLLGLLLIFAPTRALLRKILGYSIFRKLESVGDNFYRRAAQSRGDDNYGSFGDPNKVSSAPSEHSAKSPDVIDEVIDEEEIRAWTKNVNPEDFDRKN